MNSIAAAPQPQRHSLEDRPVPTPVAQPRHVPSSSAFMRLSALFNTPRNAALSLLALAILGLLLPGALDFLILHATWSGSVESCRRPDSGACWPFIANRFGQFVYGFYPEPQRWRVNSAFALILASVLAVAYRWT